MKSNTVLKFIKIINKALKDLKLKEIQKKNNNLNYGLNTNAAQLFI